MTPRALLDAVAAQARRDPDARAVVWDGGHRTRRALLAHARGVARALGPQAGAVVAVELGLDGRLAEALLGVWGAGGVALPVDPALPAARRALLRAEAGSVAALGPGSWPEPAGRWPRRRAGTAEAVQLYTSGSTGRPKGARVPHAGLWNLLTGWRDRLGFGPGHTLAVLSSPSFDMCLPQLLLPLVTGGTAAVLGDDTARDGARLAAALDRHGVTHVLCTPGTWRLLRGAATGFARGRTFIFGGEALSDDIAAQAWAEGAAVWVGYGVTEASACSTLGCQRPGRPLDLGTPLPGVGVRVVDPAGNALGVGVEGEIVLSGVGVSAGYRDRPEETRARFAREGAGWSFRTGDRGAWTPDGALRFLGRADRQVKIRGHRVEPGEVEAALGRAPGVRAVAVDARPDGRGSRRLVAWVVLAPGHTAAAARAFAAARLPAALVPGAVVAVAALPLGPTGKVDVGALREPGPAAGRGARPGREAAVAAAMADALGVAEVAADEDLLARGADSIVLATACARLREAGLALALSDALAAGTVEAMLPFVAVAVPGDVVVRGEGDPPLTDGQRQLLAAERTRPGDPAWVEELVLGPVPADDAAVVAALGAVAAAHPGLRTGLASGRQVALPAGPPPLVALGSAAWERTFDLANSPPWRAAREGVHLRLRLHHAAVDGGSVAALARALARALRGEPLPPAGLDLGDLALRQAAWRRSPAGVAARSRWAVRLAGLPPEPLPEVGRSVEPGRSGGALAVPVVFAPEVWARLGAACRAARTTPAVGLVALWSGWLAAETGHGDRAVVTVQAGEERSGGPDAIANLANALPIRVTLGPGAPLTERLTATRAATLDALSDSRAPFDELARAADPRGGLAPIARTAALLQPAWPDLPLLSARPPRPRGSPYDAGVELWPVDGGARGWLRVRTDVVPPAMAHAWAGRFVTWAAAAIARPADPPPALPPPAPAARSVWRGPALSPHPRSLLAVAEAAAETRLTLGDTTLTMGALLARAAGQAERLVDAPAGPLGVRGARPLDTLLGVWTGLLAGRPVALLPTVGQAAAQAAADAAGVAVGLSDAAAPPLARCPNLFFDGAEAAVRPPSAGPDDVALVLFTSGSTGAPRPVGQRHAALAAWLRAYGSFLGNGPGDVFLNWLPLDHVASLAMFHLAALEARAPQVHLDPAVVLAAPGRWLRALHDHRATLTWAPTFGLERVLDAAVPEGLDLSRVRALLLGGERVRPEVARAFTSRLHPAGLRPDVLVPGWGMSETCSAVLLRRGYRPEGVEAEVGLGAPLPGVELAVVDDAGRPVRPGEAGRLRVRGPMVTAGGPGAPDPRDAEGWLDTGDRAAGTADGLVVTGRVDDVLVLRGAQVSPQAVEDAAVASGAAVPGEVVAFAARPEGAPAGLAVWFVPRGTPDPGRVRAAVADRVGVAPQWVEAVGRDALLRTGVGKLRRAEIQARFEAGAGLAWQEHWSPRPPGVAGPVEGAVVLLDPGAPALVDALVGRGLAVVAVPAGDAADVAALPAALARLRARGVRPAALVHVSEVARPTPPLASPDALAAFLQRGPEALLAAAAALGSVRTLAVAAGATDAPATSGGRCLGGVLAALPGDTLLLDLDTVAPEAVAARVGEALGRGWDAPVERWRRGTRAVVDWVAAPAKPPPAPRRAVLVGGPGGVGRALTAALRADGAAVAWVSRTPPAEPDAPPHVVADVTTPGALAAALDELGGDVDLVVFLAADPPASTAGVTRLVGLAAAASWCRDRGVRLVDMASALGVLPAPGRARYAGAAAHGAAVVSEVPGGISLRWAAWRGVGLARGRADAASTDAPGFSRDEALAAWRRHAGATGAPLVLGVRRAGLSSSAGSAPEAARPAAPLAPGPGLAAVLAAWTAVLGRTPDPDQGFFEAGGDSLALADLAARLSAQSGRSIDAVTLFRAATPRSQAALLGGGAAVAAPPTAPTARAPIAVIGLGVRVADADGVEPFWALLAERRSAVRWFSREDALAAGHPPARIDDPAWVPARAPLDEPEAFDAAWFGIPPAEAALLDPQHRVWLEVCAEALDDAAVDPADVTVGVFGGCGPNTWLTDVLLPERDALERAGGFAAVLATDKDHLVTRAAHRLGLRGPAVGVQTACSTGLVAVALAVQSLRAGACEIALAGGVSVAFPSVGGHRHEPGGIGSPDGRTRSFAADAAGAGSADGCAVVVLKPLAAALRDGDPVRAVLLGAATNNDGADRNAYTTPSLVGQAAVVRAALRDAGRVGADVAFVEAHGTATPVGDPVEVDALRDALGPVPGPVWIGSVKSNLGHANTAAGAVGLAKAVLGVGRGVLPPTLHVGTPRAGLAPLAVAADPVPLPPEAVGGVSSFGAGGTNAHVVLAGPPPAPSLAPLPGPHVLRLSAVDAAGLARQRQRVLDWLAAHPDVPVGHLVHTLAVGRPARPARRAWVGADRAALCAALRADRGVGGRAAPERARVWFVPGQGAQRPGVGAALLDAPAFAAAFRACDARARALGLPPLEPLLRGTVPDAQRTLDDVEVAGAYTFALAWAAGAWVRAQGIDLDAVIGQSTGEYAAAALAGALPWTAAMDLLLARGRLLRQAPPGGCVLVAAAPDTVAAALPAGAWVALDNGPQGTVVAGGEAALAVVWAIAEARGWSPARLRVGVPAHTPLLAPLADGLRAAAAGLPAQRPTRTLLSPVTGGLLDEAPAARHWVDHLLQPQRTADALRALPGAPAVLVLGPTSSAADLFRAVRPDAAVRSALPEGDEDAELHPERLAAWLGAVGAGPWRVGVPGARRIHGPTTAFARTRHTIARVRAVPRPTAVTPPAAPPAAPRRARPDALVEALGAVLGRADLDLDTDLLAAGADSLSALRMAVAATEVLGRTVTGAEVLAAGHARRLLGPSPDARPPCLVPLRTGGDGVPLVLVHPAGGGVFPFVPLARAVAPGRPVWGLQAASLGDGLAPDATVDAMARRYHDALGWLGGPVHLGAFSFGCYVAYALALRLEDAGTAPRSLVLIDEAAPLAPHRPSRRMMAHVLGGDAARSLGAHLRDYARLRGAGDGRGVLGALVGGGDLDTPTLHAMARLLPLHLEQTRAWRPPRSSSLGGWLVRSAQAVRRPWWVPDDPDPTFGWSSLLRGGVTLRDLPGDHLGLVRPPVVSALAGVLDEAMAAGR